MRCPEVGLEFQFEVSRGRIRIVRNSRSRCGCGGAQVFECVRDLMRRIERRRLTLDDCDDRRHDRVQRERPEAEMECSNPTSGQKKTNPTFGRKKKILPTTTSRRRTERETTEDNETEGRRDERVLLDRVVARLGGLSGRPVSDPPKTP